MATTTETGKYRNYTVPIEPEQRQRLRVVAAKQGKYPPEIIRGLISDYLENIESA